jgi:tetratricopeptide (TPR) repeat protein
MLMKVAGLTPIAQAGDAAPLPLLWGLAAALVFLGLVGLIGLWLLFGRGPRRARTYRHSQRLLRGGKWQEALSLIQGLQHGRLSKVWEGRLRNAEGECQRTAGVQAVQAADFEPGLEHHLHAAELLNLNPSEIRASVVERMLVEVRALFAGSVGNPENCQAMIDRVLAVKSPTPEASFWQGLCYIRDHDLDRAVQALQTAREAGAAEASARAAATKSAPAVYIDPPLYLGGALLKQGQAKEGLRWISEAHRVDSNCPLVALHLGIAMVAAGADSNLASRALGRALTPRGLPVWLKEPEKAWTEGMPEGRSYIRKLALKHSFVCPLWGNDLRLLIYQGRMALGQAQYRLEQYDGAAETFQKLLDESAPTHDVLRWLGVTLARLKRYDEAFKHLKTTFDLEEPKDSLTAGYLALCAACGKPNRPEDKGPNVAWGVRMVRGYEGYGDREWVWLIGQVFGEALKLNMALSGEDQLFLCDHLVSVQATDQAAALAFHQIATEHPGLLKPVYAWHYCQAALQHHLEDPRALDLYALTFQTAAEARPYFVERKWDFEELEYAFLREAAIRQPGHFPAVLGPEYPPLGEAMLLQRSERFEQENKPDGALASADVLLRLAPQSPLAHNRLAYLWYKRGKLDKTAELLRHWCDAEPSSAVPRARLAVIEHKLGQIDASLEVMRAALQRSAGKARADLACLGARLALAADKLDKAQEFLEICLQEEPLHTTGLWLMAAARSARGDRAGLAAQAAAMTARPVEDPRFNYFAAVSALAAGDYPAVWTLASRAAADTALEIETAYLAGWASIHRGDVEGAVTAMRKVAQAKDSPSVQHARAILGAIRFHQGAAEEAVHWWQQMDAERRVAWKLAEPLQSTLFVAGLQLLGKGHFEQAADKFREAGKAGLREKSLPGLIQLALLKAGQQLLCNKGAP